MEIGGDDPQHGVALSRRQVTFHHRFGHLPQLFSLALFRRPRHLRGKRYRLRPPRRRRLHQAERTAAPKLGSPQRSMSGRPYLRRRIESSKRKTRFQTILKILARKLIDFNFIIKIFLLQRKRI
jgi:hypothetical protein